MKTPRLVFYAPDTFRADIRRLDWQRKEAARALEVSVSTIDAYLKGKRRIPKDRADKWRTIIGAA